MKNVNKQLTIEQPLASHLILSRGLLQQSLLRPCCVTRPSASCSVQRADRSCGRRTKLRTHLRWISCRPCLQRSRRRRIIPAGVGLGSPLWTLAVPLMYFIFRNSFRSQVSSQLVIIVVSAPIARKRSCDVHDLHQALCSDMGQFACCPRFRRRFLFATCVVVGWVVAPAFAGGYGACMTISGLSDSSINGVGAVRIMVLSYPVRSQNTVMHSVANLSMV